MKENPTTRWVREAGRGGRGWLKREPKVRWVSEGERRNKRFVERIGESNLYDSRSYGFL